MERFATFSLSRWLGILLKGNGPGLLWPHVWPILLFTATVLIFGLTTFRRTLD